MRYFIFFFGLLLLTACEDEPLDPTLQTEAPVPVDPDPGDGGEAGPLELSAYELDVDLNFDFFGTPLQTITNSVINIQNDKIVSSTSALSFNGSPFVTENQTITRNASGQITSQVSVNAANTITNESIVTYDGDNIATISYEYFEDDEDDYFYSFTYEGNNITRTEESTTITTVFTLDNSGRVIQKESFDDGVSILNEVVTYSASGNIQSSSITGEIDQNITYSFDENLNPLQIVYDENYILRFLQDVYDDEIGQPIAQFNSTNNWSGATYDGESFSFDLIYDEDDRILTRDISINLGDEFSTVINERFIYIN